MPVASSRENQFVQPNLSAKIMQNTTRYHYFYQKHFYQKRFRQRA